MDNDLERSVRLLEDALTAEGRGLIKNIGKGKRKEIMPNISITLNAEEMKRIMETTGRNIYEETLTSLLHLDNTVTGSVIRANAPWKAAADSLFTEFFEVLQSHSGGHDILDIVADLARCCSDAMSVVQGLKSKVAVGYLEEEKWLEHERNIWRLLFILYQDRLHSQNLMDDDILPQYFGRSEKICVQNLFKRDSLLRESQLVIDWLERNAADKDDETLHFSDSTVGWENTLHQLQSADTIAFGSSRQIVSHIDPDATHYERKPLHDLDVEDEKRLTRKIFAEIRCGKLDEAEKLCRQCGHSWRAAMFEGWRLFHNASLKDVYETETDSLMNEKNRTTVADEIEGNSNRDIWKIMAIKYCKQDWISTYEKAAIAAFCGYIDGMLPVCHSWDDMLWAYMKSMVDIRVESEIRDCCMKHDHYMPLSDEYWAQRMSLNEVFANIESSKNSRVREESKDPERIIEKYIILDEIPKLIHELDNWVQDSSINVHFLRMSAHLVLFLDQIGLGHDRESIENILQVYIKQLMEMNETQLVAYYVSKLNPRTQIQLYASYLEKIVSTDDRKAALMYAENSELEVFAITKQVVENIRNYPHEVEVSGNLQPKLTETDKFKISALDWVIFYESQRLEALIQTNALIFTFLTLGKLDAAQLAFNKVPPDSVDKILSEGDVGNDVNQTIKEYLSYKSYLDAQEAFNEWFMQCKTKPLAPENLPASAQFAEKVAHQHRVSQHKAEMERWKLTTLHLAKSAKILLYNVLMFPEGWLVGAKDADYLRSTCIPETVLLLYTVLFESGLYEECIQLADIVAAEKYCLYKVYSKEKLGEILVKLCESSVALLNEKKDPFGN